MLVRDAELMDIRQAARVLGRARATVREMALKDRIRAESIRGRIYVSVADVEQMARASERLNQDHP